MRDVPAAIMHGGGSVLFTMTAKFASDQRNKKHMNCKKWDESPLSITTTSTTNNNTKTPAKMTMATNSLLHQTNLP
jgi:hypothetical protein